jgi:hypothetical protein
MISNNVGGTKKTLEFGVGFRESACESHKFCISKVLVHDCDTLQLSNSGSIPQLCGPGEDNVSVLGTRSRPTSRGVRAEVLTHGSASDLLGTQITTVNVILRDYMYDQCNS